VASTAAPAGSSLKAAADLEVAARVPLGKLQVAFEVGGAKAGRLSALQARSGGR
jgi:hypothetical protein